MATFDPEKGSAFAIISWHARNQIRNAVEEVCTRTSRFQTLDPFVIEETPDHRPNGSATQILEEVRFKIGQITTICTDPKELEAERWMVASLVDADFDLKRHEIGDVAMQFGLTHSRSRELCDQTILAIRRLLWGEICPRPWT